MESTKKAKCVLIVEDDEEMGKQVANALNEAGYEATCVQSVREASFKLKAVKYACVVVDMNLGKDSGEMAIAIAQNPKISENSETPILIMSGTLDKAGLLRIAPKIKGVLVKPFGVEALLEQVEKLCGAA